MTAPNAPVVLLVEDHADTRMMYAVFLRLSGFEVLEATDAEEGLSFARAARPAIVVTDLGMPGPSSVLDLCKQFSAVDVPVLAVTGNIRLGAHAELEAAGCAGVLLKPVTPETLLSEIRRSSRRCAERLTCWRIGQVSRTWDRGVRAGCRAATKVRWEQSAIRTTDRQGRAHLSAPARRRPARSRQQGPSAMTHRAARRTRPSPFRFHPGSTGRR